MTEEIIAVLKAAGLEAYKNSMSQASKSTEQVGKSSTSAAKETEQAATSTKGSGRKIAAGLAIAAGGAVVAKKAFGFMKDAVGDATQSEQGDDRAVAHDRDGLPRPRRAGCRWPRSAGSRATRCRRRWAT